MNEPPFKRTTCDCYECKTCCRKQPGFLIPGDAVRIAAFLNRHVEQLLWDSPGALVMNSLTRLVQRVRTITPRLVKGRCVFLDGQDRCTIHPVAPYGCSHFDTHMGQQEGHRRSIWGVRQVRDSADYQAFRKVLMLATSYKPTITR